MYLNHPVPILRLVLRLAVVLLCCSGCDATTHRDAPPALSAAAPSATPPAKETWYVITMQDKPIGYRRITMHELPGEKQPLRRIESLDQLSIQRFGQATEQQLRVVSMESPSGAVQSLEYQVQLGQTPKQVRGTVRGDRLVFQQIGGDGAPLATLPWSQEVGGYFAIEQSLRRSPMQPGEKRTVQVVLPLLDAITKVELVAQAHETTELLVTEFRLLKIDESIPLPDGTTMEAELWVDEQGEVLKQVQPPLVVYRATRSLALDAGKAQSFDLGYDVIVPVDRPLPEPQQLRRAVYEVTMEDGDPAELFPSSPAQQVRLTGPDTARLIVETDPTARSGEVEADRPMAADREASRLIESEHEAIVQLANRAIAEATGPRRQAIALENFVHGFVEQKDYSRAFASAAEVAATREGDCTEHAVLLAALCRAADIPCRVAIGLVYLPSAQGFAYHMWNEAWIDGQWLPLDATQGQGRVGADHLTLATSSLQNASAYTSLLPVLQAIGRLKIRIVETR